MCEDREAEQGARQAIIDHPDQAVMRGTSDVTGEELQAIKHALDRELGAFRSVNIVAEERLTTGQRTP